VTGIVALPAPPRRRRRRRFLLLLLLVGSAVPSLVTTLISVSLFVDGALIDGDAWAPAPITVRAEPSLMVEVAEMLPGDVRRAEITVENPGADPVRYAVDVTATATAAGNASDEALRDALVAQLWPTDVGCVGEAAAIFSGPLVVAAIGDPSAGDDPGDRRLEPAGRETLCIRVELPASANNELQAASTTVTFAVIAERWTDDR
jgi:hypothetical protein